jgi:hypothetical protein
MYIKAVYWIKNEHKKYCKYGKLSIKSMEIDAKDYFPLEGEFGWI